MFRAKTATDSRAHLYNSCNQEDIISIIQPMEQVLTTRVTLKGNIEAIIYIFYDDDDDDSAEEEKEDDQW